MIQSFFVGLIIGLLSVKSYALTCVADPGQPYLTPLGLIVTQTTYELRIPGGFGSPNDQIGADFESRKDCQATITKMKSDKPFVCLQLEQGPMGAIVGALRGKTYGLFGPNGKRYGIDMKSKAECEDLANRGTRAAFCTPMGHQGVGFYGLFGAKEDSKKRFGRATDCLELAEKMQMESEPAYSTEKTYLRFNEGIAKSRR